MTDKIPTLEEEVESLEEECDYYANTVMALKTFVHEMTWDAEGKHKMSFGRSMHTSANNRVSPNNVVTPDLVLQCDEKWGIIGEAKMSFSRSATYREQHLIPVMKYDDKLAGWYTADENISGHDLVLIVNNLNAVEVREHIEKLIKAKKMQFNCPFALISFYRADEKNTFMVLGCEMGAITDAKKQAKLHHRVKVKIDHINKNPQLTSVEMYDHQPPIPLMMRFIEDAVVQTLTPTESLSLRDGRQVRKEYSIDELRELIGEVFSLQVDCHRTPMIPAKQWIVDAMEVLVLLGWAERLGETGGRFAYWLKKRRGEPFDRFVKFVAEQRIRAAKAEVERAQSGRQMEFDWGGGRNGDDRKERKDQNEVHKTR